MKYEVLIQPRPEGKYYAVVLNWPDINATGESEQEVLEILRLALHERLAQGRIVHIEVDGHIVEAEPSLHPWSPFLGMWKNDPTFDDLMARIQEYRRELDREPA